MDNNIITVTVNGDDEAKDFEEFHDLLKGRLNFGYPEDIWPLIILCRVIGDNETKTFAQLLTNCKFSLNVVIHITCKCISDIGVVALAQALYNNTTLRY